MSQATVDPTLEALVPRGSAWRSAGLVVLALALLVGAWLLPPTLKPGIGEGFGASWQEFAAEKRVVLLAQVHPSGLGGVRVRAVDDLPGAHVVDAWVVDGDLWSTMPAEMPTTAAADYVAALPGVGDTTRLPRTVTTGGDATLVVLWQVDDCATLTNSPMRVDLAARWGATRTEDLGFSPLSEYVGTELDPPGPCS